MKNAAKKADGSIIPNSKDLSEMEENFNKLTPAETERLAWLIEECGEVVKAGSKILRLVVLVCHLKLQGVLQELLALMVKLPMKTFIML
jgi:hypothetical protein